MVDSMFADCDATTTTCATSGTAEIQGPKLRGRKTQQQEKLLLLLLLKKMEAQLQLQYLVQGSLTFDP